MPPMPPRAQQFVVLPRAGQPRTGALRAAAPPAPCPAYHTAFCAAAAVGAGGCACARAAVAVAVYEPGNACRSPPLQRRAPASTSSARLC